MWRVAGDVSGWDAENHKTPFDLQILRKNAGSTSDQFCHKLGFWEADQFVHSPLVAGWQKFPNHGYTIQFFRLITWRV